MISVRSKESSEAKANAIRGNAATGLIVVVALLTLANVCLLLPAHSDVGMEVPREGMSPAAVLGLWDSPQEKIKYEIKREELWKYDQAEVLFKDGRVVRWKPAVGSKLEEKMNVARPREAVNSKKADNETSVEDILSEIMSEAPQQ